MDTVGINNKVTKFDLLLTFMGSHNHDPYDERTGDAPDHVQQSDFFGVWRRICSDASNNEPKVRDAASLARPGPHAAQGQDDWI